MNINVDIIVFITSVVNKLRNGIFQKLKMEDIDYKNKKLENHRIMKVIINNKLW